MAIDVSLTSGMRTNLTSLQSTVDLLNRTQERLATGKKVNNALDNPLNFFTAQALTSRANDLAGYKDAMSEAVQTVKAANNGITAISGLIAQAKAIAASAKATTVGANYNTETLTIGADLTAGETVTVGGTVFTAVASGATATQFDIGADAAETATNLAAAINTQAALSGGSIAGVYIVDTTAEVITFGNATADIAAADIEVNALNHSTITFSGTFSIGDTIDIGGITFTAVASSATATATQFSGGTGVTLATSISSLSTAIDANEDDNDISVLSESATTLLVASTSIVLTAGTISSVTTTGSGGVSTATATDSVSDEVLTSATDTSTADAAADRANYYDQYEEILAQIDLLATDSGYKGTNLLEADTLDVAFGPDAADKLTISGSDTTFWDGLAITKTGGWASNTSIDTDITAMDAATNTLKARSSSLSSGLSIVNTRQDWVKSMVNTLTQGADNLTLADMNEEGANMLMLQTRQALGTTALSLSAQAAQSVLKLF